MLAPFSCVRQRPSRPSRNRCRPAVEFLEDRTTPSTFTLVENFNAPGTSSSWEGRNFNNVPGHPGSMPAPFETGPDALSTGEFLRLKEFTASGLQRSFNTMAFRPVDAGDFQNIVVDFDFRITAGGQRVRGSGFDFRTADGFAVVLMDTGVYGTSGVPFPLDERGRFNVPTRSFALGFNTFDNLEGTNNSVTLAFNNGTLAATNLNLPQFGGFDVVTGSNRIRGPFQHGRMNLALGGPSPQVTVTLTTAGGQTITPFNQFSLANVVVGGVPLAPYNSRLVFSTRTGDSQESVDIDNINAEFTTLDTNQAPTADANGPYSVAEGGSIALDGTGSSDPDEPAAGLTYEWDLDYDGVAFNVDAAGAQPAVSFPDDFAARTIALRVTDAGGLSDIATTTLEVANVAPSVAADNAAVAVDEGQTATNTGTFSDPGDDIVAITASIGSVTQVGSRSGTWSWSFDATDGPDDSQTVTITATDSDGAVSTTTFALTVHNLAPTASIAGPAEGFRNATLSFTLDATDPSSADQAAGFDFNIDWDGDGVVDETVSGPSGLSVDHVFAVAGQTTVIMTATDKDGDTSAAVSHGVNIIQPLSAFEVGPSQVSLNGNGVLPMTIFSTADFDVTALDVATLRLSGAAPVHHAFADANGDGALDLVLHFRRQDFIDEYAAALRADLADGKLDSNHQLVTLALTGKTLDGADVRGFVTIDFFMTGKKLEELLASL